MTSTNVLLLRRALLALVITSPFIMACTDEIMPAHPGSIIPNPPRNIQVPFASVFQNQPMPGIIHPNAPRSIQHTEFQTVMPNLPLENLPLQNPARSIQQVEPNKNNQEEE